jgi:type I site-specific restriction endonuclease
MARPTKSRALYAQMAGRATRPHESIAHKLNDVMATPLRRGMIGRSCKPGCLIIDFVGNSGKHKLMTTADILGGNCSDEAIDSATEIVRRSGKSMRMDTTILEEDERIAAKKAHDLEEAARKSRLVGKSTYKVQVIDPFDCFHIKPVHKTRGWDDGLQLSDKQRKLMKERMGLDPDAYTFAQAKQILNKQFEIWNKARENGYHACSLKQINLLKKFGVDALNMPMEAACKYLDAIANNRWKGLPEGFVPPIIEAKRPEPVTSIEEDNVPF